MLIEYIGHKAMKVDNVAGTGVQWTGPGDVREVPDAAAPLLLRHEEVWRRCSVPANDAPTLAAVVPTLTVTVPAPAVAAPRYVLVDGEGENEARYILDHMDADALRAFAETAGVKLDARIKDAEKLRVAIYKAVTGEEV